MCPGSFQGSQGFEVTWFSPWHVLASSGSSWLLLAPPGSSLFLMASPGRTFQFLTPPGPGLLLAPGFSRPHLEGLNYSIPPGSSWLLLAPHCSSWFSPGLVARDEFLGGPRRTHGDPGEPKRKGLGGAKRSYSRSCKLARGLMSSGTSLQTSHQAHLRFCLWRNMLITDSPIRFHVCLSLWLR